MTPDEAGAITAEPAQAHDLSPQTVASDLAAEDRQGEAVAAIAFAALTPEFLLR